MAGRTPKEEQDWLSRGPQLQELMDRYPALWEEAGCELVSLMEDGRTQRLGEFAGRTRAAAQVWDARIRKSRNNLKVIESAIPHLVRSRMLMLALDKCYLAAATGKVARRTRFNLLNGYIIQKLLFSRHLTRKPASLGWFRFWWPLVWQKRLLMPLVQPKGIFCFYSSDLIESLAVILGAKDCIEIAAGDGTLSRFLSDSGIRIRATDNYSWQAIEYPDSVERLDAKAALDKYNPEAVICSWPPPANSFERHVFSTRSVVFYIVIGSRYGFASGNRDSYSAQTRFEWGVDPRLSALVLPPELESSVIVFRRRSDAAR
jgi:hypothetical protein